MQKIMLVVVSLLFSVLSMAQQRNLQSLVGRWEAVREVNDDGGLEVVDSSALYLLYGTEKKKILSYKADFTQAPARFDFAVQNSADTLHLKSLLDFINDDLIKWQLFEGDELPVHFASDRGQILYLRRKK